MHHPTVAERDSDMRDAFVRPIGEEKQIGRDQLADVPARIGAQLRLLPGVARQLKAVQ